MHSADEAAERRADKLTLALRSIEDYVDSVAMSNHGMKADETVQTVTDSFRRSMQANTEFHDKIAKEYQTARDIPNMNYHKRMAQVYAGLFKWVIFIMSFG